MSSVSPPPSSREAAVPGRPATPADVPAEVQADVQAAGRPARPSDLPSVERLLISQGGQAAVALYGHARITRALRHELELLRRDALAGTLCSPVADPAVVARARARIEEEDRPRLRPVFNLTGTVLHTNLGRALLPDAAVQAVISALLHPMNLEYDLESGKRGDRDELIEDLLCELTGAEAATVVNNNAAAVLLMLNALADRRQVIVSRGELVEIGGAFRIPDIMKRAGAKLMEVGTTNRTHASDYQAAIGPRTALLMKVHCSNYAVSGFTKSVDIAQVTSIAHAAGLPSAVDLGSGTLVDLAQWGLPREETVADNVRAGADVVTFSGDKLLGGPQAGLIVGRADLIRRIKKNPLKRALRVGKLTLAALEPVLQLYRSPELLSERLTTLRLLTRSREQIRQQAERVLPAVRAALGERYDITAEPMMSQIGSGALPVDRLPSYGLAIRRRGGSRSGTALRQAETRLRKLPRPVIGRIGQDTLWLDLRCLERGEEADFLAQLAPKPDAIAPKERA